MASPRGPAKTGWSGPGSDSVRMSDRALPPGQARGFTLLELLVVLVLAGLLLALVAPRLTGTLETLQLRSAVREVHSGLRQARAHAQSSGAPVSWVLDIRENRYGFGDQAQGRGGTLDARIQLELYTAEGAVIDRQRGAIVFYPDGSASGGEIRLALGERHMDIHVNWLTGRSHIL